MKGETKMAETKTELKEKVENDYKYKNYVRQAVNVDPHVYNLLLYAFMGGYTHSNWTLTDQIIKDVDSFDFTSSYPYVMTTYKYPRNSIQKM